SHSDQWLNGNSETVLALIAENPDPQTKREALSNLLPRVAMYGDTAAVTGILATGADLERRSVWNGTALMHAAERGLPGMVGALLKAGANAKDSEGRTAFFFGAGSGNEKVVKLLLDAGADANENDKYGDTPLMGAAAAGNPEVVALLLKNGARVNARNRRRQSALLSAAQGGNGYGISEQGRRPTKVPDELIHRDIVVRMLLEAGADINAHGWDGETALFTLQDDVTRELLRHHAKLEARDKVGQTPLIETVSASIASLLIEAGANVNAHDKEGRTALIRAAENNYVDLLPVLLKAPGIRLDHRDKHGNTALMAARKDNLDDCVHMLIAAGATQ
ncbi:MAG: ankyrin repeat domain-containing protein, partial [Bryobacteraceae bacterium]